MSTLSPFARTPGDCDVAGRLWIVQTDRVREYASRDDD